VGLEGVFRLSSLEISPQAGGQPLVGWSARYIVKATGEQRTVEGHVEIRWSHGRFGQPPKRRSISILPMKKFPAITNSEVTMNGDEASRLISTVDDDDHDSRVQRLIEMDGLLPTSSELMGFAGQERSGCLRTLRRRGSMDPSPAPL